MNNEEKSIHQTKYDIHQKNKRLSREQKAKDVEEAPATNKIVCCYDLQTVLSTPNAQTSVLYYKSKLSTFNFTIYDIVNKRGYCFVWHEGIAKRGANEIGTFFERPVHWMEVIFYS